MNIDTMGQATSILASQQPATKKPLLKTVNDLPKVALQLIPPLSQAMGSIGNNINVSV